MTHFRPSAAGHILSLICIVAGALIASAERTNNYSVHPGQFDKLAITDNVNVIYRCMPDSTGYAAWTGDARFDNAFIFTLNKGKLTIQVNVEDVNDPQLPTITVYSDFLTEVMSSSLGRVIVENPAPAPKFKAELMGNGTLAVSGINATETVGKLNTGNGQISLEGKTRKAKYIMVGTGTIQADELEAEEVSCKILGSGSIGCDARDLLKAGGVGSTKIYYKGNPQIKKTGGGKLIRLDDGAAEIPELPERE